MNIAGIKVLAGIEVLDSSNRVRNILDIVDRLVNAIIHKQDYRAATKAIWKLLHRKLDEYEQTRLVLNRLKKEANIFQLIRYSNHLVSIYPKLQTMNYLEA